MFQLKLRRALVSATLLSTLALLPAHAAAPRSQRPQQARSEREVAVRLVPAIRDFVNSLLAKVSVRIDPNGNRVTIDEPSSDEPVDQANRER